MVNCFAYLMPADQCGGGTYQLKGWAFLVVIDDFVVYQKHIRNIQKYYDYSFNYK
jgi:hypothetical protein